MNTTVECGLLSKCGSLTVSVPKQKGGKSPQTLAGVVATPLRRVYAICLMIPHVDSISGRAKVVPEHRDRGDGGVYIAVLRSSLQQHRA